MALVQLPNAIRSRVEAWAWAGYPEESCGLLIGACDKESVTVTRATQARNLNRDRARDRYLLDPQDFLEADLAARAQGVEIVGTWHSHPDHPALPSETDRAAAWPNWSYLIVAVDRDGVSDLRAWRLNRDQAFDEEKIQP